MNTLPTLFLSHGSPLHAVKPGAAGEAWKSLADALPRPRAILVASAHWETSTPLLTAGEQPETIHDFSGFPAALYDIRYPARGAPQVAARAVQLLRDNGFPAALNACRGLDHGAWVPLLHMYPGADIPVLQLAIQTALGPAHHYALGAALRELTSEGVLIIASGHMTHNLADWWRNRDSARSLAYIEQFRQWLDLKITSGDVAGAEAYREQAPSAARAHPTEEHLLPLFVAWGAAGATHTAARGRRVYQGMEGGGLAMDAYRFDQ